MRIILVTGAAGFIGAVTCKRLLEAGFSVIGMDNLNDYYDVRLKQYRLEQLKPEAGFTFVEADVENARQVEKIFEDHPIDAVVNLAARAGVRYSLVNPHVYVSTNVSGTLNLLEAMRRHGVTKMVLASTSSLYAGQQVPFSETLPVNTPISPYAASKKAAEMIAYAYHYLHRMDVSILRYFTVYGPAGRPDMSIFRFIQWIAEGVELTVYGDGSQTRDFTYVDDIAEGTVRALKPVGFQAINLGNNRPHPLSHVIALVESSLGKKARVVHKPSQMADLKETWADITKAKQLLGWQPQTPLEEGIRKTVAWHIANRPLVAQIQIDLSV